MTDEVHRLKQCPFCGNKAQIIEHDYKKGRFCVGCLDCNVMTDFDKSIEYVVSIWNKRVIRD